jgi:predicted nucleic acid-binding protein
MPVAELAGFLDSNVVLYLLSADEAKADVVERLLKTRPVISVQVLNEVAHVCRRELGMAWDDIAQFLDLVRSFCTVEPLTEAVHDQGRLMAERYQLSFYDACIVAAAATAGCGILYTEDMNHGQVLGAMVTIRNPFLR